MSREEIHLRSDVVSEMMETPPHWLIRSGMIMVGLVVALALLLSVMIRYPEHITSEITIFSTPEPQYLSLPENAKILKVLVNDEQAVFEGQPLLNWHYPSTPEQTFQLKAPMSGRLFLAVTLADKVIFNQPTTVFLLVAEETKSQAGSHLPEQYRDKVKPGDNVSIALQSYAQNKYGFVAAEVMSVSRFISERGVWVEFALPEKLITNRNIELPFQPTMQGKVTVNIDDKRIIERLFPRVAGLFFQSD